MEKLEKNKLEVAKDGEVLNHLNEQFRFEKEQLERIRRQKLIDLKEEYDRTLNNKYRNAEAEKIIDEEENDEIRVYAEAKKKMAVMKRQREIALLKYIQNLLDAKFAAILSTYYCFFN